MASLVDTNVLVYRHDPRYPDKRKTAHDLLRAGLAAGGVLLAHQTLIEFVSAVTRATRDEAPLLSLPDATREVEAMLTQFDVLYPTEEIVELALRGAATYQLSWFDAHMWAYAEYYGLDCLLSEDFQNGRRYGHVRVVNPFL